jgi:Tol biopolymer transport system component
MNYNQQRRKDMIQAGAYDGRFKQKVVKDKKKEQSRKWAKSRD